MICAFKKKLRRSFPGIFKKLDALKTSRMLTQMEVLVRGICHDDGPLVQTGPFAGMRLPVEAIGPLSLPKLIGSYEAELHVTISQFREYSTIVNIGCAEGYYTVGLAKRMPRATVYAFDILESARRLCLECARLNGVLERVKIESECRLEVLRSLCSDSTLIVCDCEGCEYGILSPEKAPELARCDLLVELHALDAERTPGCFIERFRDSHDIIRLRYGTASRESLMPGTFSQKDRYLSANEFRNKGLEWVVLTARRQ